MRTTLIALIAIIGLSSCSNSFDYEEGERLIDKMKNDHRIYTLTPQDDIIWINGKQTSIDKNEIKKYNEMGIGYVYRPDYLEDINVTQEEFDKLLKQFKKTNAYSLDFKNDKAYFILDSFLDDSNGILYSDENLVDANECAEGGFRLNDVRVCSWKKVKGHWYNANGMH